MGTAWNVYDGNKMSSGAMYGRTLAELAAKDPRIVGVTADLAKSTNIGLLGEAFPDRLFNVGIAEQNLFGVAAGLANSDTRFHREKWPSSLTRGRLFHSADKQTEFDSRNQQRQ